MATTMTLKGRLADITSVALDEISAVTVKAPSYRPGPAVELTTSQPRRVDLGRDGFISIDVVEGIGWLYLEGQGWSDSIRFVAAAGMKTIWEAVVNALPIVVEAKRLLTELGLAYEAGRAEILDIAQKNFDDLRGMRDRLEAYILSSNSVIDEKIKALEEAYASSAAGVALPPYLTQESLNRSYGFYVYDEPTLDYAIANFQQINLKPGVRFLVQDRKTLPENVVFRPNGATIITSGKGDFVFEFKSGSKIEGDLNVEVEGNETSRGVLLNGDNITADAINVTSTVVAAGSASGYASGVTIAGNNISVGNVHVKNFEYGVNIFSYLENVPSKNIRVNRINIQNYQRGLWIRDVQNLTIGSANIYGKSPTASLLPGHNGVLVESRFDGATSNLRVTATVEDSGEHGFRIGGQFPVRNVWINNSQTRNTGGCGFKALGGIDAAARHYNINYVNCTVEDAGQNTQNQSGFLIERVSGGSISNAIIRKATKARSCFTGIRINNCQEFIVSNANISDTAAHGIDITGYSGSCERVVIAGGVVRGPGNCGINIDFYGATFRRVAVTGRPVLEVNSGLPAFRVSNTGSTGGPNGGAFMEFIANGSSPVVQDNVQAYIFDIYSDVFTETNLVNGSTWRSRNDGVIRRKANNVWAVL